MIRKDGGKAGLIGHYLSGNIWALMCCWKITPSFADTVTIILLCGYHRKDSPAKYFGLCSIEYLFRYHF